MIFYFLCTIGVFSHAGILCITAETFTKDKSDQFIQFLWCALLFCVFRWIIGYLIVDVQKRYKYTLKRHETVANKFLGGIPQTSKDDDLFNEKTQLALHSVNAGKSLQSN
jgi:hypothetical protein